jgi:IclR family pca regulon transcriptional regulator
MSDGQIGTYLEDIELEALTPYTIVDKATLTQEILRVRRDGYCLVEQELEEGLHSIAAPVIGGRNEVVAAINVSCHASRVSTAVMRREFLPRLLATASEISADIGALRVV